MAVMRLCDSAALLALNFHGGSSLAALKQQRRVGQPSGLRAFSLGAVLIDFCRGGEGVDDPVCLRGVEERPVRRAGAAAVRSCEDPRSRLRVSAFQVGELLALLAESELRAAPQRFEGGLGVAQQLASGAEPQRTPLLDTLRALGDLCLFQLPLVIGVQERPEAQRAMGPICERLQSFDPRAPARRWGSWRRQPAAQLQLRQPSRLPEATLPAGS